MSSDASSTRTIYLLKRAETAVRAGLDRALAPLEVTPAQYVTLSLLKTLTNQSSAELARKAGITPQAMSETIAGLIKKQLIARTPSPEHRRVLVTKLTRSGGALLAKCDLRVDALEARALGSISSGDLKLIRAAFRKIIEALP